MRTQSNLKLCRHMVQRWWLYGLFSAVLYTVVYWLINQEQEWYIYLLWAAMGFGNSAWMTFGMLRPSIKEIESKLRND